MWLHNGSAGISSVEQTPLFAKAPSQPTKQVTLSPKGYGAKLMICKLKIRNLHEIIHSFPLTSLFCADSEERCVCSRETCWSGRGWELTVQEAADTARSARRHLLVGTRFQEEA